jgi:hypothetical protein
MSRSNLVSCWNDFSPAAHLSATMLFFPQLWQQAAESGGHLAEFLAYAEALRIRGESHLTGIPKRPLLDPETTWKVPDWVILPQIPELVLPSPSLLKAHMRSVAV